MNEQTERQADKVHEETARAVSSLYGLGLLLARHGLLAGRSALQTSARTLYGCAGALAQLAESLSSRE